MTAISGYRTKVLAMLDDPSLARYTNNQVDAALSAALETYSQFRPDVLTYTLDTDGQRRIDLPADFEALAIVGLEQDSMGSVVSSDELIKYEQIPFRAYFQDSQWSIETKTKVIPIGDTLTVVYNSLHYIDGLNGATGTSVPASDEELIVLGAAGNAAASRASTLNETNNLNPKEAEQLFTQAVAWLTLFEHRLGMPTTEFAVANWKDNSIDKDF